MYTNFGAWKFTLDFKCLPVDVGLFSNNCTHYNDSEQKMLQFNATQHTTKILSFNIHNSMVMLYATLVTY